MFEKLTQDWTRLWPTQPPIAPELRVAAPDRWVRFHSLPESKRYAETAAESAEILRRHNTAIADLLDLGPSGGTRRVLVMTCAYLRGVGDDRHTEKHPMLFRAQDHWMTITEDEGRDDALRTDVFVRDRDWTPGCIDDVLALVADDQIAGVIIANPDLHWLYLPYDGGADVIVASTKERDSLSARHADWLSTRADGL